jgi:hypothetical protein
MQASIANAQLRYTGPWTDEAMDHADATYTNTHAWRCEVKTKMTTNSFIGGSL